LADEQMQLHYYGVPAQPELADAKKLYEWVLGDLTDSGEVLTLASGPAVLIEGITPKSKVPAHSSP